MNTTAITDHHAVSPETDERFTGLLERSAERRRLHHVNLALVGGGATGQARPRAPTPTARRYARTPRSSSRA